MQFFIQSPGHRHWHGGAAPIHPMVFNWFCTWLISFRPCICANALGSHRPSHSTTFVPSIFALVFAFLLLFVHVFFWHALCFALAIMCAFMLCGCCNAISAGNNQFAASRTAYSRLLAQSGITRTDTSLLFDLECFSVSLCVFPSWHKYLLSHSLYLYVYTCFLFVYYFNII